MASIPDLKQNPPGHAVSGSLGRSGQSAGPSATEQRLSGTRAELASLRAQLRTAKAAGDLELERVTGTKLSRRLVSLGIRLDTATRLARRSLLLGEDPRLREELSSWFASLGRLGLAAGTLEPLLDRQLPAADKARLWIRIAVLRARNGELAAAASGLLNAAEADARNPLPLELYGAARSWSPSVVDRRQAAAALLAGSERRELAGDERTAIEDVLQAVLVLPSDMTGVDRIARQLNAAGRPQAADEVWRRCVEALPVRDERTQAVHHSRLLAALNAQMPAVALGAALDLEADRELDFETVSNALELVSAGSGFRPIPTFDGLLYSLGLAEWLLQRAQHVALRCVPYARAKLSVQAAKVLAGPMNEPERAGVMLIECLWADPGRDEVYDALQEYTTSMGDLTPIVEGVVGLGRARMDHPATRRRLEQLARLSDHSLRDPSPGVWALDKLSEIGNLTPDLATLRRRLSARIEEVAVPQFSDWAQLSLGELRHLLEVLSQRPGEAERYAAGLTEMCQRDPAGVRWFRLLERVLVGLGREPEVQNLWQQQLSSAHLDPSTCRAGLLRSYQRVGQAEKVLELMAAVGETVSAEEAAHFAVAASEVGSDIERAAALALVGRAAKPAVRATLLAVASDLFRKRGDAAQARVLSELACRSDSETTRAFVCCAESMGDSRSRVAGLIFERACRMALPRIEWCRALADVAAQQDNRALRLKWLRRWASLAPLDAQATTELLLELAQGDDEESLEAALDWLLGQPQPSRQMLVPVTQATRRLAQLAPARARALSRRLIGVYGVVEPELVIAIEEVAEQLQDAALRVALLERQVVQAKDAHERADLLLATARLRIQADDADQAFDNLSQALAAGADVHAVREVFEAAPAATTSDAQLQSLEIALTLATQQPESGASREERQRVEAHQEQLRRKLAYAYRDLASDQELACQTLERGLDPTAADTPAKLFRQWVDVVGPSEAVDRVELRIAQGDTATQVAWRRAASRIALDDDQGKLALRLARPALELSPLDTELLSVVEAALPHQALEELEAVYALVQKALLGPHGERALHYRAAREFERRDDRRRAFNHAVGAFEAVPALGITFALMSRLAHALGEGPLMRVALARVAALARTPEQRAFWLDRAVQSEAQDAEGLTQRLEVLLRALAVCADADAVRSAGEVLARALSQNPREQDALKGRFQGAVLASIRGVEPEVGAAIAVAAAEVANDVFADPALVADYASAAIELSPLCAALSSIRKWEAAVADEGAVRTILTAVVDQIDRGRELHPDLLRLCRDLAETRYPAALAPLAVALAKVAPNDSDVIAFARRAASSDSPLREQLEQVAQPEQRAQAVLEDVSGVAVAEQAQRLDAAIRELRPDNSWFDAVLERLAELGEQPEAAPHVESSLGYLSGQDAFSTHQRAGAVRVLIELLTRRQAHSAALDALALLELWRESTAADQRRGAEIAHAALDEERELSFLAQLELHGALGGEHERAGILSRIAELHAAVGSRKQATHYYERVLTLQPDNQAAQQYLLEDAERSEDFAALAARLEEQLSAERGTPAVALRLYQLYTERLGQPDQGRIVLERALDLHGEDEELLSVLGKHLGSVGQDAAAAKVYQRAGRESRQLRRASHYAELACRSFLNAGDDDSVKAILAVKGLFPNTQPLAEMRVEVARKRAEYDELAAALEELSVVSKDSAIVRAGYLLEAAQLCLDHLNDFDRALALSERGSRMAPNHVLLQLFTRMLQYRKRGAGSRQDALYTITELRSLRPGPPALPETDVRIPDLATEAAQAEVRAFLLAEALRERSGPSAGLRELVDARETHGALPLLELGLAERLSQSGELKQRLAALQHFAAALNGDLRQLRSPADVALQAAELSMALGELQQALEFAQRVPSDAEQHSRAEALISTISAAAASPQKPQEEHEPGNYLQTEKLTAHAQSAAYTGNAAARHRETALGIGLPASAVAHPEGPTVAVAVARPRMPTAPGLGETDGDEFDVFAAAESAFAYRQTVQREDEAKRPPSLRPGLGVPPPKPSLARALPRTEGSDPEAPVTPKSADTASERRPAVVVLPSVAVEASEAPEASTDRVSDVERRSDPLNEAPMSARRSLAPTSASERKLMQALSEGSVEAGDELLSILESDGSRTHELVAVCRLITHWLPGDVDRLRVLHQAVVADNDPVYARALLHAQRALNEPETAPVAPPLHRQTEHVDAVVKLLAGPSLPGHEALGLLWQHTPELFRNNTPSPIAERRIEPGTAAALSQLLGEVARLFGCARVTVHAAESAEPSEFELVLTHPAALILRGQIVAEAPGFRYQFGRMMFATRPEYALVFGLETAELNTVLHAVGVGFGPPRKLGPDLSHVANLAERLWEMLPPHVQRRLGELCEQQHVLEPNVVVEGARRALRRAGLFVCGDLSVALREAASEEGVDANLDLRAMCERSEAIADLVRFATSLEYADARWRSGVSRSSLDRFSPPST